jgi:hypothetical protein
MEHMPAHGFLPTGLGETAVMEQIPTPEPSDAQVAFGSTALQQAPMQQPEAGFAPTGMMDQASSQAARYVPPGSMGSSLPVNKSMMPLMIGAAIGVLLLLGLVLMLAGGDGAEGEESSEDASKPSADAAPPSEK